MTFLSFVPNATVSDPAVTATAVTSLSSWSFTKNKISLSQLRHVNETFCTQIRALFSVYKDLNE